MIEITRADGLWTLTLNRPEKANSLTPAMLAELADAVEEATREGAAALVLTGRGKVFSAGADLEAARAGLATDPVWERLSGAIAAFPGLSLAALNGSWAGGACGMVLACDLRISVPEARTFYPVVKLGFLPQPSDPGRMVRLIGPARAKMILVAGQTVLADEALAWGLIDRVVPGNELAEAVAAMTAGALAARPGHLAAVKAMVGG